MFCAVRCANTQTITTPCRVVALARKLLASLRVSPAAAADFVQEFHNFDSHAGTVKSSSFVWLPVEVISSYMDERETVREGCSCDESDGCCCCG